MINVTFDSNVWRQVVSPSLFNKDPNISNLIAINAACKNGQIQGMLSETIFTIEAIKRTQRQESLQQNKPNITINPEIFPNGLIKLGISIGPDTNNQPKMNTYLIKHWEDAEKLGFRILPSPRIASFKNEDLKKEWFISTNNTYSESYGKCSDFIESLHCGGALIEEIGNRYIADNETWHIGIKRAPETEKSNISSALAEWADGDTVAAHYAIGNDCICTRDIGKSANNDSVFSPKNRAKLETQFRIKFVNIEELCTLL